MNCRNYRYHRQAKVALRACAKMACGRMLVLACGHTDKAPPVDRQHPPHHVIVVELGKPVVFRPDGPVGKHAVKRVKGQRVRDRGESKRRAVMVRIGDNVLYSKEALTSAKCEVARVHAESSR